MSTKDYKQASAIARKRRAANIAAFYKTPHWKEEDLPKKLTEFALHQSGYYTEGELAIIQSEADTILENVKSGKWTALEVAQAFCKGSALAQELTNCVTEVLYPEAMERAKYLDDYLARTGKTIGPLHGLPISLKDCFITAPHPSSNGMACFANEPTEKDSLLVTILRDLGAVFYVKTNVPVAMMMAETDNNVWGETRNPLHKYLSPGGSSGGEGAIIAFKASPLGVGTDIGGSIRIPAGWCHLYGLKPSFGRYPTYGGKPGIAGQEYILAVNGPMSRSLKSLQLYSQSVLSEQVSPWEYDHKCLPIPWRKGVIQPSGRKLRIGLIGIDDGLVTCHPPVERALKITREALEREGHEVVPWSTQDHEAIVKNLQAAFYDLGGAAIMDLIKPYNEPVFPSMEGYAIAAQAGEGELGPTKMRQMNMRRNELQKAYLDRWNASATDGKPRIDGIIQAVSPWAAPRLGETQRSGLYVGYTGVWNFLDFAACTFPVLFAGRNLDPPRDPTTFRPLSDIDSRIQADYDADFYDGAPVSLQIVGRRLEEEKVLEMCEVIDDALKKNKTTS
ncbi:Acetamidase [Exophiala dermatitidis]